MQLEWTMMKMMMPTKTTMTMMVRMVVRMAVLAIARVEWVQKAGVGSGDGLDDYAPHHSRVLWRMGCRYPMYSTVLVHGCLYVYVYPYMYANVLLKLFSGENTSETTMMMTRQVWVWAPVGWAIAGGQIRYSYPPLHARRVS